MKLLDHQVKFARGYKNKALLAHEGGTGKTICACVWLHDGRDEDALVICPKRVVKKWQDALMAWDTKATVLSKEQFKKHQIKKWSAVVVDEADEFASPLFLKDRSQLSAKLYNQIREHDSPILLLTATPIRSTPWNLHSILCFMGVYYDWKKWRNEFFVLEHKPFLKWSAWFPKRDWRTRIRPILEKYSDIVLLRDCVDELPPVEEIIVKTPSKPFAGNTELNPSARFFEEHQFEQTDKLRSIVDISKNYRKVLVVAYYIEQIEELNKQLSKERLTFMVHGGIKKQEEKLKEANEVDECFLIVQASLGAGFDADFFSCVIFVSMSYKVRDHVQMRYRVRRIHNLHPVRYHYLISGKCDKRVYETIQKGKDFVPSEWTSESSEIEE